ncbi:MULTISPECIES: Sec-independent protein translocase subunit TatA/TatB [Nonlabens]|uniref:Sec-independent protein secretion pathway component n=4 Tax=Nonlabens TaxID=363408 RepID=A0A081D8P7_NONUL|nr:MULTISPECIES: twin-arginine translocase TatA/TatE family subunit [Nonlabens]MBF4982948.1 twin-arginine translocase TatA/TatE family subunit [Nonlabens mediterrranea]KEZ92045.1 Sec-independent protein secretion pathway component [Nonlabens ulvanivorans]PQJ31875.1 Sec-independent protein translocase TatA [Nonlabens arenilitoris]PRX14873.1 sec-independent protein translocase protein TatA [Nonlabens ulvanivorans]WOI22761.1 twin-arginine translocase TatA/TatE family subunit [Nonlabens ulvanivora
MISLPLFISTPELMIVGLVVILVFGSDKLPEIARGIARAMNTVRNATDDIKNEISKTADEHGFTEDVKQITSKIEEVKDQIEETGSIKRRF